MIRTYTGDNSFGLRRAERAVVEQFTAEHGDLALERLDGQEAAYEQISEALTSLPFLAAKKLVILRNPGANKKFLEHYEHLLSDIPETTDVIINEPKLDKRLSYYKYLKRATDFTDFTSMDANELSRWLVLAAKEQGGTLSSSDAFYLIERVGVNQQLVSTDLEKLLLYDPVITRNTIDLLTEATPQSTIFQLLEAAFAGNTGRALELYAQQRALKVEPQQIVAMLAWQLHVLATIKTAGDRSAETIAKDAKLNPFVVRKSQSITRMLPYARLKQLISDLLTIDVKSKRTSIDLDAALQYYLLKLAG